MTSFTYTEPAENNPGLWASTIYVDDVKLIGPVLGATEADCLSRVDVAIQKYARYLGGGLDVTAMPRK